MIGSARVVARRVLAAAAAAPGDALLRGDARAVDSVDSARNGEWHRRLPGALGFPSRSAVGHDAARRHRDRHAHPRLLDGLHVRRAAWWLRALLLLPEPLLLLHADARPGKQLPGDVRRLGGRRPLLVSVDRLLVREEERRGCGEEGVRHQPHRRLGLHPRRVPRLPHLRHARFSRRAGRGSGHARRDDALRRAVGHLPAPLRRRHRQERADSAVCLAAGRDGRPDAGFRAHPCGDDGHGRRLHGGPERRALLARARWSWRWWPSSAC